MEYLSDTYFFLKTELLIFVSERYLRYFVSAYSSCGMISIFPLSPFGLIVVVDSDLIMAKISLNPVTKFIYKAFKTEKI